MKSEQTPAFGDMVGDMFRHSNPGQQAGVLNQILASVGPAALMGPGQNELTPTQASQLTPAQVSEIAGHAQNAQPGVIDQVSRFYAQHAGLIKMLGGAVLAVTMAKMKENATRG